MTGTSLPATWTPGEPEPPPHWQFPPTTNLPLGANSSEVN
jgi:hypothetical protein